MFAHNGLVIAGGANTCSGSVAPKKTCSFEVEFAPKMIGPYSRIAQLFVTYNGASPAVTLSGDGTAVTLKAPKPTSFTAVDAGSVGSPKNISFSNPGTVSVTLGAAALGGTDPGSFKIFSDACSGKALAAKGKCTVGVEFARPSGASGKQSATLSIGYTFGANNGNVSSNLSGKVK